MLLGLNLSFATKRWLNPERLAALIRAHFPVKLIQFTWDLIDPWWPEIERDILARRWSTAFEREGLTITSTFGGLAAYTYPQLLAPAKEQRDISLAFFKRAIDITAAMNVPCMGTPVGGMSHEDAIDREARKRLYQSALESLAQLARYGKEKGLSQLLIEATPLLTEFPHSPQEALRLMRDLDGVTDIPIRLLVDWGHALYEPLLKEDADMALWLDTCAPYVEQIHIQQTDGMLDRHWDFTVPGIVTEDLLRQIACVCKNRRIVQYAEFIYPFEAPDEDVFENVKESMNYLCNVFGRC